MITSSRYLSVSSTVTWLKASIESSGSTARKISYTADPNDTMSERTGYINLDYGGSEADDSITIKQAGKSDEYIFTGPSGKVEVYATGKLVSDTSKSFEDLITSTKNGSNIDFRFNGGAKPGINTTGSEKTGTAIYFQNESNKNVQIHWKLRAAIIYNISLWINNISGKNYRINIQADTSETVTTLLFDIEVELTYSGGGSDNVTERVTMGKGLGYGYKDCTATLNLLNNPTSLNPGAIIKGYSIYNMPQGYYTAGNEIYNWTVNIISGNDTNTI